MIQCTFEDGGKGNLRHVTAGALVLNEKNEILLTKRSNHLLRGGKYALPAGYLNRNEVIAECALRELFEETGIKGKVETVFSITDNPEKIHEKGLEGRQNVDFIYIVTMIGGEFTLNDEVTEINWFSKENLPKDEEFAFDHKELILRYFDYLEKPFALPIFRSHE